MNQDTKTVKRFHRRGAALIAVLLLLLVAAPVSAQDYRFAVDELKMQVFVQPDASAQIVYDITFSNQTSAHAIDIVDLGMPHADYDISNMTASVGGVPVTDIRTSEFVDPGVEVHLGSQTIPAGGSGTLHFEFTMPDMVYQDVTDRSKASLQITPTWFGNDFVVGTTHLQIAIYMPEGVKPEDVVYQDEPFTNKAIFQGKTVAVWDFPNVRLTESHLVGVSFDKSTMTRVISLNVWQLAVRWFENHPEVRVIAGIIAIILFSFLFFRFSGGTGWSVWFIVGGGLVYLFVLSPGAHLACFPFLIALILINEGVRQRGKKKYMPAIAQVEGGGIKRGLTAPEAAAILELPINKVLTLIIFGLLKKGVLRQVRDKPLAVEVVEDFRAKGKGSRKKERTNQRRQAAQEKGIVLHNYEQEFLDVLEDNAGVSLHMIDLSGPMKGFLHWTANRVKGFDQSDTQDYYRQIVSRAITEAKSIGEIPEREKAVDRNLEWILMGDERDYQPVFGGPSPYRPIWVRPIFLGGGGHSSSSGSGPAPAGGGAGPTFGNVAAGFAGWAENTMGDLAGSILPGTIQAHGGAVDLSGFDKVTGDIFEALASSSGGSGGGGGGCACAGCACACACAGGGR